MLKYCFLVLTFFFGFSTFLHAQKFLFVNYWIPVKNCFLLLPRRELVPNSQPFTHGAQPRSTCVGAGCKLGDMETQNQWI